MNRIILILILLLGVFASCSDNEPYRMPREEFPPIKIYFTYTHVNGEDLLNPDNPNNVLSEKTYVAYKDVKYTLESPFEINPNGEESKVDFRGLRLQQIDDGRYAIVFGALDSYLYYKDEILSVGWGNGCGCNFRMNSVWTYDEDGLPDFYKKYESLGSEIEQGSTFSPIVNHWFEELTEGNYAEWR